jgi:hypothetical protein
VTRALVFLLVAAGCGRWGFGATGESDANAPPDDTGVDDSSSPPSDGSAADAKPCAGTTHTLTENFDDNTYNAALWGNAYTDTKTMYAETGGRLVITLGTSSANDWAGYVTTLGYELANDRVFVEVPQISASGTNTMLMAAAAVTFNDGPSIESESGRLEFRKRAGGTIMDLADIPYNAVEHRWWQIRESNGRTYWELSSDGLDWLTWYQEPSAASTTAFITLVAGTNGAQAAPGSAIFDNLNGGGAPPDCP